MTPEEQAKVDELTRQVQGLAAERNTYRQTAEAWKKLGESFEPGTIQYDANGVPVGVVQPSRGGGGNGAHPFAGVLEDPSSVDAWVRGQADALIKQQGFVTNAKLEELVAEARTQALNESRLHGLLWRGIDRLTTQEKFKGLSDYSSDFSKRVAKKLQDLGLGKPLHAQAADFATDWAYDARDPYRPHLPLQQAAELAWSEMQAEAATAGAAASSGQAAQAAAGLAAGAAAGGGAAGVPKVQELINQQASPAAVSSALDEMVGA